MKYKNPFQNKKDIMVVGYKTALHSEGQTMERAQIFALAE